MTLIFDSCLVDLDENSGQLLLLRANNLKVTQCGTRFAFFKRKGERVRVELVKEQQVDRYANTATCNKSTAATLNRTFLLRRYQSIIF